MMAQRSANASGRTGWKVWRAALLHALPVAVAVPSSFTYCFALADRYTIFLYDHDMGPLGPYTAPFGRLTSSRYWMAGLVASGAVLALHGAANWLLGRLRENLEGRPLCWLPRPRRGREGAAKGGADGKNA